MHRAIGVIDSGVGGLTVVSELMRQLPKEKLIYLGDTLRCPYGPRPAAEVKEFTFEMVDFLLKQDIKMIVIACNTATAFALEALQQELLIPVLGVIRPGARAAINATKNNKIAVIGTEGTINSEAYPKALNKIKPSLQVTSLACPEFVPLVEAGILTGEKAEKIVNDSLVSLKNNHIIDTLILGCTHYPLLEETIQTALGPEIKLISSSQETARATSAILELHQLLETEACDLNHEFYMTGELAIFEEIVASIFNPEVDNLKPVTIKKVII